mmetsp:Transcript_36372/g.102753  ORF Transcript_36372/g.102753 Transcript_36372/m.102753 type:complete len:192 (+) Transcript_36372:105-680(+)|eukprot:CAMPEP_0117682034 /NCGR_PEP_ID=MMETSP0804-20121206/19379_1 /TAXON_ID=1074897 /ORGANISM="Tetraselmis astigmatica, Strain CCMP880" /LENGTH=191 /DNA_ID=CAMNT_0005491989 /DNA_START=41 /DNA_END=616 /DNA_ORIENTATION=-
MISHKISIVLLIALVLLAGPVASLRWLVAPGAVKAEEAAAAAGHLDKKAGGIDMPEFFVGEFTGGLILENATTGKSLFSSAYFLIDSYGGYWGTVRPIMQKVMEFYGNYTSVEPIVNYTNYTAKRVLYIDGVKTTDCWVWTLKNSTKKNTTTLEGFGAPGDVCPENKKVANFTGWLKPTPKPTPELETETQ